MADLGAVAREPPFSRAHLLVRSWPTYAVNIILEAFPDLGGTIAGTVTESGSPVVDAKVFLIWRPTMQVIKSMRASPTGAFSFTGLSRDHDDYTVVALDPDSGTQYKDVLYSHLTPV